jgi:hypothetical protein
MEILYTPYPASIPKFLNHVQSAGVPDRLTQAYLKQVGFKSSNDRYLIKVMKTIGFVGADGAPTARWRDYRDRSKQREVLADGIRHGYPELFKVYPDADRKDAEALRNFFGANSSLAENTLKLAVTTFRTLVGMADFVTKRAGKAATSSSGGSDSDAQPSEVPTAATTMVPVQINIELHLPATDDSSVYDRLFESLRKNLMERP